MNMFDELDKAVKETKKRKYNLKFLDKVYKDKEWPIKKQQDWDERAKKSRIRIINKYCK